MSRIRWIHAILIAVTIPLGLGSRLDSISSLLACVGVAYSICVLIEVQQLIKWAPLVRLREETPADILLGHGFLWTDLVAYAAGVLLALGVSAASESLLRTSRKSRTASGT